MIVMTAEKKQSTLNQSDLIRFRSTSGWKRQLFLSSFLVTKLKAIAELSGRDYGAVFRFCIKHAVVAGALKHFPYGYQHSKDYTSIGVRMPLRWLKEFKDIGWTNGTSQVSAIDYYLYYSLSAKSIEDWVAFFLEGQDLVYEFWIFLYQQQCQNHTQYQLEKKIPKQKGNLILFNQKTPHP